MTNKHPYCISGVSCCRMDNYCRFIRLYFLLILICFQFMAFAQPVSEKKFLEDSSWRHAAFKEPLNGELEELLITLNVPRIGSIEIPALIFEEIAYLPVKELFDFLKIRNRPSSDFRIVEGYFMDPGVTFIFDKINNKITYRGRSFELLPSDMIVTESGLYLRSVFYGQIFGLDCRFSFRSLSVNLVTNIELPALQELKQENMYRNLNLLKGERKADTTIRRRFSFFRLGMFDWSVINNRDLNKQNSTRLTLGIGGVVAGGEANLFLNLYNDRSFKMKEQYYFWRHANNENKIIRQVTLGKILANPSSTVYDGINGIQITNAPTTFRRSFGSYTLSDKTEPGWMVELYVNNVLVNFTRADASGFFTFDVPMVYGNSIVKLRYYGPWGEERTKEQIMAIPFNFLPKNQLEYSLNAGIVEDNSKSRFSRAQFNYGLSQRLSIGGGMEYLSSLSQGMMPFLNTSFRLRANFFISGEYIHGVRSKGTISYRHHSNLRVELNYLRYDKDQKAVRINYLEEKKLVISRPFMGKKVSAYTRLTINQFKLSNFSKFSKYTSTEFLISAVAYGISSNLASYAIIQKTGMPLAYSNLSMTFRLPFGISAMPQAQYEYTRKKFSLLRAGVEKSLFKRGFLNLSYEWDLKNKNYLAGVGFRYALSFAQAAFSARRNKQSITTNETVRGSIMVDARTKYIGLNDQNNVGKGGLIVAPYLDFNCNGKREKDEPAAPGLKLRINGGRMKRNDRDTTVRVIGLDPYTNYFLELDKSGFDNIGWQIHHNTIRININPNHFTYLEIPVSVLGEVSGTVYFKGVNGSNGLGRIIVNIYGSDSVLVAHTVTEADGYFSYLGLPPGNYTVKIDPGQLKKLHMKSNNDLLPVVMRKIREGDNVNGLVFYLSHIE